MKYCENCGEQLDNQEALFCKHCGHKLQNGSEVEKNEEGVQEASVAPESAVTQAAASSDASVTASTNPEATAPPEAATDSEALAAGSQSMAPEPATAQPDVPPTVLPTASVKRKMSTGMKVLIGCLAGGVALIAALVIVVISLGVFRSDVERFRSIQQQTMIEPLAVALENLDNEEEAFSTDIFITVGFETDDLMMMLASNVLEQITLELNINLHNDQGQSLFGAGLSLLNEDILSLVNYTDDEVLGFYIPSLGAHYTIDLDDVASLAELNSYFEFSSFGNMADWTGSNMAERVRHYGDILLSAVNNDNLTVENGRVRLFDGNQRVDGRIYTFAPSEAEWYDILSEIIYDMRDDELLFTIFEQQMSEWELVWLGYETFEEYWQDIFAEALEDIDEVAEFLAENFTWRTVMDGRQLVMQEFAASDRNDGFRVLYEAYTARGGERTHWITIEWQDTFSGNMEVLSFRNQMTTERGIARGDFSIYYDDGRRGAEVLMMDYEVDISTRSILGVPYGVYHMEVFEGRSSLFSLVLEVEEGRDGGTDHLFTLSGLEDLGIGGITLTVHSTDEPSTISMPSIRAIDLSSMPEERAVQLLHELMWDLEDYLEELFMQFSMF